VYVVDLTGGDVARDLCLELRRAGIGADRGYEQRSMKSQMKSADRSGARLALIVGEDELANRSVTLRPLREDGGQSTVPRDEIVEQVRKVLS
jgi:histidyl-tRNA synthetase